MLEKESIHLLKIRPKQKMDRRRVANIIKSLINS